MAGVNRVGIRAPHAHRIAQGERVVDIAADLGCTETNIYNRLRQRGLRTRDLRVAA